MSDVYMAAESYRDSILTYTEVLAGDALPPEPESWQEVAGRLARELRRYADFLDRVRGGDISPHTGPVCFPSWKED